MKHLFCLLTFFSETRIIDKQFSYLPDTDQEEHGIYI